MVVKKGGILKSTKKSPVNLAIYRTLCGERGSQTYGFLEYHKIHKYLYISYL